jgi:hypothetical protein
MRRLLNTADVLGSSILVTIMMEALPSSETSVLTIATLRNITKDGSLHSPRLENFKYYIAFATWVLKWRHNEFLVRYELGFYTPEYGIIHSHRRENRRYYK